MIRDYYDSRRLSWFETIMIREDYPDSRLSKGAAAPIPPPCFWERSWMILKNTPQRSQKWEKGCPRGGLDLPCGPLWSHVTPKCSQGRLLKDFWSHLDGYFDVKICEIWCWFSMYVPKDFWRDFGEVPEVFWVTFWCHNEDQNQNCRFVEIVVLPM